MSWNNEVKIPGEVLRIAYEIKNMKIRGAGRIARAVAEAMIIGAESYRGESVNDFKDLMRKIIEILSSTRPTAVSLFNALSYISRRFENAEGDLDVIRSSVITAAREFISYSLNAVKRIGEIGSRIIKNDDVILTHCNSSVVIETIIRAFKTGKRGIKVLATETRPKFQGHITAKMLSGRGIPVVLIPDSSVRYFMKDVDKVIVGADTIAANGAVVNKIGTSLIALIASEANVDFLVMAETYKFSPATLLGEYVKIEERSPEEVIPELSELKGIKVRNPAFDVTPPEYITAIITEIGIIPPQASALVIKEYGWPIANYEHREIAVEEDEPIL
ncbi:MAG TPA: ribose 1,5-bisphosphate isomerase [Thermofilum sp.]|nr:ribose 1,5-bisphosphate isomerase [Thermofilum sp.]